MELLNQQGRLRMMDESAAAAAFLQFLLLVSPWRRGQRLQRSAPPIACSAFSQRNFGLKCAIEKKGPGSMGVREVKRTAGVQRWL